MKRGFCEKKFSSMLISGTFTKAVMYLMLLSDSIIAGHFIGASGVAGINAITPVTAIVTFFGDLLSTGVGIVFTREVGAMRKDRANEIYGQGLILSIGLGLISALLILVLQDTYFRVSGVTGDILENALKYYRLVPINAFLTIVIFYLEQMVYSDGDELCNNICYGFQIGGNVVFSVILTRFLGMTGIILGSVIGNSLGILTCLWHYFRKENTLRFVWHLSFKDFLLTSRYSIVDSSVYICWGLMDYVMIGFVSSRFGEAGLITLAVVVSLIEFGVVMDGVGMAMQPLIGTYFGERNHQLIKRVMRSAVKAAVIEGLAATALIWAFTRQFCALFGITGGEALARKTFNPRMGITGGISIIGTTGIVEPMSSAALVETIRAEANLRRAAGYRQLLLTVGNYSSSFLQMNAEAVSERAVTCSNFIGDALDIGVSLGFEGILLVGHIGKLVKLGSGIMNTHSSAADGRMETLIACGALAGVESAVLRELTDCVTVDAALSILFAHGAAQKALDVLTERIDHYLQARVKGAAQVGAVIFSDKHPVVLEAGAAQSLIQRISEE